METASQISGDVMEPETAWMDLMKWIVLVRLKKKKIYLLFLLNYLISIPKVLKHLSLM